MLTKKEKEKEEAHTDEELREMEIRLIENQVKYLE